MSYGIELAAAAGGQAAGNFINEGMGIAFQGIKNKQQLKQARRLQDLGLEAEATRLQRNEALAMRMWENTGYGAQVDQLKRAGLNPGLLYGMGGSAGGSTAQAPASGGGASAGTAQASSGNLGMGIQLGLMEAQRKNIEADTAKKLAETAKTSGADTANVEQDTINKKAGEALTRVQTEIAQVQASVARQTILDQMKAIENAATKGTAEIVQLHNQNAITATTMEDQVLKIKAEAIGAVVENALKESHIEINKQEVITKATQLLQGWKQLTIEGQKVTIQAFTAEFQANHPGIMNVLGGAIQRLANGVAKPMEGLKIK